MPLCAPHVAAGVRVPGNKGTSIRAAGGSTLTATPRLTARRPGSPLRSGSCGGGPARRQHQCPGCSDTNHLFCFPRENELKAGSHNFDILPSNSRAREREINYLQMIVRIFRRAHTASQKEAFPVSLWPFQPHSHTHTVSLEDAGSCSPLSVAYTHCPTRTQAPSFSLVRLSTRSLSA